MSENKTFFSVVDPSTPTIIDIFWKYLPLAGLFALLITIGTIIFKLNTKLSRPKTINYYFDYESKKIVEEKRLFFQLGKYCPFGISLSSFPRDTEIKMYYKPGIGPRLPIPYEKTSIYEIGKSKKIRINDIEFLIDGEAEYIELKIIRSINNENFDKKIHVDNDASKITITNENPEKILHYPIYLHRELSLTNRLLLTHEGDLETFKDSKEINGKKCCGILKVELPGSIDGVPSKREFIIK